MQGLVALDWGWDTPKLEIAVSKQTTGTINLDCITEHRGTYMQTESALDNHVMMMESYETKKPTQKLLSHLFDTFWDAIYDSLLEVWESNILDIADDEFEATFDAAVEAFEGEVEVNYTPAKKNVHFLINCFVKEVRGWKFSFSGFTRSVATKEFYA